MEESLPGAALIFCPCYWCEDTGLNESTIFPGEKKSQKILGNPQNTVVRLAG